MKENELAYYTIGRIWKLEVLNTFIHYNIPEKLNNTTHNLCPKHNPLNMYSKTYFSATEVWYAHPSIWILLLLPYPPSNSQLQLFSIPTREEESHVSLDNETIMAVPDLLVAISNTSWGTLPYEFPPICPDLKAITIVPSLILVTHETEECHVNRGHAKLESFKVKAEVLTKTMKYLMKIAPKPIRFRQLGVHWKGYTCCWWNVNQNFQVRVGQLFLLI